MSPYDKNGTWQFEPKLGLSENMKVIPDSYDDARVEMSRPKKSQGWMDQIEELEAEVERLRERVGDFIGWEDESHGMTPRDYRQQLATIRDRADAWRAEADMLRSRLEAAVEISPEDRVEFADALYSIQHQHLWDARLHYTIDVLGRLLRGEE